LHRGPAGQLITETPKTSKSKETSPALILGFQQPACEFKPVLMKKFLAHLSDKKNSKGTALSAKRIHNILIPLRVIVQDAFGEYGWSDLANPFAGLKLPKVRRIRIHPFKFQEWNMLMEHLPAWYRPYFELAVQTGLRPSEQVALKWQAIDERFIHIELSRVRGLEKGMWTTPWSSGPMAAIFRI
jgi:integrase